MSEQSQPLVLGGQNILEMKDKISGVLLEFSYRLPTQAERDAYTKATMRHKGNKVLSKANTFTEQAALGKRVLLGFKKGCLANEAGQIISSDKTDPDFDPSWKDLLDKYRKDILAAAGRRVINSTSSPDEENNFEVVEDFGEDPSTGLFDDISTDAEDPTNPLPTA
ncbi:hypothetical protein DFW101_0319 [Solidesulfovibrio carbinoliphilus subsp. oakridgensis]|uniref:Uncharacterized protein n=1 Tax=Solidesulfovibrio carbinoliphilus subsp. oakridgensis TaxID=694327 RepID=G7QD30_9BACT|nr:hypothetical protein [Solidesulfovibrio carbinoliphilus]EHJ46336.1 hypothetical protein DFW101_0319 [Solidesulfovibrio carbinoliphilus subsp. oakridgensis]